MPRRPDTRDRILDAAQELIQSRGYNAISFDHIARAVGIRKPTIIHHFPNKAALGVAVVERYRDYFGAQLRSRAADPETQAAELLDHYFGPYRDFGAEGDKVCLCGALAGEFMALPEPLRDAVRSFFLQHIEWLAEILDRGRRGNEFGFEGSAEGRAGLILDAAQGALIVTRATARPDHLQRTLEALMSDLLRHPAES